MSITGIVPILILVVGFLLSAKAARSGWSLAAGVVALVVMLFMGLMVFSARSSSPASVSMPYSPPGSLTSVPHIDTAAPSALRIQVAPGEDIHLRQHFSFSQSSVPIETHEVIRGRVWLLLGGVLAALAAAWYYQPTWRKPMAWSAGLALIAGIYLTRSEFSNTHLFPSASYLQEQEVAATGDHTPAAEPLTTDRYLLAHGFHNRLESVDALPKWTLGEHATYLDNRFVTSGEYATPEKVEQELLAQCHAELRTAAASDFASFGDWTPSTRAIQSSGLVVERVRHVRPETVHLATGDIVQPVYKEYWRLRVTDEVRSYIKASWRAETLNQRLAALGGGFGGIAALLATSSWLLRRRPTSKLTQPAATALA